MSPAGKSSVTVTSCASDGPLLSAVKVYLAASPGTKVLGSATLGDGHVRARIDVGRGAGGVVSRVGVGRSNRGHDRVVRDGPRRGGRVDPDDNTDGARCPPAPWPRDCTRPSYASWEQRRRGGRVTTPGSSRGCRIGHGHVLGVGRPVVRGHHRVGDLVTGVHRARAEPSS